MRVQSRVPLRLDLRAAYSAPCRSGASRKWTHSLLPLRSITGAMPLNFGNLSGPATRRILEREYGEYGQAAYQRLAAISVAHLYRLRNSAAYRKRNTSYQPTRPTPIRIGERRKPQPQGGPDICASTRCIRAIKMAAKVCITSMLWTK